MKFLFSCSTQHLTSEVNTRREIRYPRAHVLFVICRHGSSLFEVLIHTCLKTDLILQAKIHRIFLLPVFIFDCFIRFGG